MRVFAVSPFERASREEILDFLTMLPQGLVVLPGHFRNTPSPQEIQHIILRGSAVFVEGAARKASRPAFIVTKQNVKKIPSQIFSRSPTAEEMDRLVSISPERTISVGAREVTFFICGEILAFDPKGVPKHNRELDYDILANPAHTIMGHWNHLGKKLNRLSRGSVAVHVANNDRNRHLTTDVRIYKNGTLLDRRHGGNIGWSMCSISTANES